MKHDAKLQRESYWFKENTLDAKVTEFDRETIFKVRNHIVKYYRMRTRIFPYLGGTFIFGILLYGNK